MHMLLSPVRIIVLSVSLLAASLSGLVASQDTPERVVSLNLCTDQLAMLLARPGQLISVSHLAADKTISLMGAEANQLMINHGLAEEVFRMDPDLVVAGKYTARATVNLLKRLGKPVEEFDPATSFEDISANTHRMGALLGNLEAAERLIAQMRTEVSLLSREHAPDRPVLGSFGTNSYTSGAGTLENDIVGKAGFRHLGDEIGIAGTTRLPLEVLVLANPDYLMIWNRHRTNPSRSAAVLTHPALDARFGEERRLSADTRYWICGTPLTVGAIKRLQEAVRGKPAG
ncbi:MAG: ABC transporter substrate-binding protein [Lentilitoribacter sp.]|uniref:ABC transporter substrate-binding protein n=2 Tax=Pseudomonadota TaxID=1224 RepID=UPI003289B997